MGAARDEVLFCPFCQESFEGERVCPDHELVLVPFEELPSARRADAAEQDEPLAPYDPRYGRGLLFVGVVVTLAGFILPFATTAMGDESLTLTGFELAARRPILWALPFVCMAMIVVLALRRSPAAMRGARLAVPMLALLAGMSVAFGVWVVRSFAQERRQTWGMQVEVVIEPGVWVMVAGLVLCIVAGLRLGRAPSREVLPHGATVQEAQHGAQEAADDRIVAREADDDEDPR